MKWRDSEKPYLGSVTDAAIAFIYSQGGIVRGKYVNPFVTTGHKSIKNSLQRRGVIRYKLGERTVYYLFPDKLDLFESYFSKEHKLLARYIARLRIRRSTMPFTILDVLASDKDRYWSRLDIMRTLRIPIRSVWKLKDGEWVYSHYHSLGLFRVLSSFAHAGLIDGFTDVKAKKSQTKNYFKFKPDAVPERVVDGPFFREHEERLYTYPEFLKEMGITPLPFMMM